ncbi:MAG: SAM-dependent methyltransferase [Pirellulales bacterium]
MKKLRFDRGMPVPLFEISWEQDQIFRMDPYVVTSLLREQVPVLDFVQWNITTIEPGVTESVVPLNPQSTNQHFTHQAALFLLAADYTGGTALASLMHGWPVVGVHPVKSPQSVSMWLLKADIRYSRPSVSDLTVSARIDLARHARIQKRFLEGKAVIESIDIEFRNDDVPVAEATLTYFARQSDRLRCEGISNQRVNTLYELKLTSSAEMIAGVRAREHGRRVNDPYAADMAGQHGIALATRFCERSPQLGGMVAARTWHLDRAMMQFIEAGGRDIVIVGVGWDMRPFRLNLPPGVRIYELDFPTTLAERRRRLAALGIDNPLGVTRIDVPIDVRTMPLAPVLQEHIDGDVPVFIAWEGMSMYFNEAEVLRILDGIAPLMRHRDSLLWVDVVDREAVESPERFPDSVQKFMRGMQILGEPFTFGTESPAALLQSAGFDCLEVVPSDVCITENDDPVYAIYRFCLASLQVSRVGSQPKTFRPTRLDGKTSTPPAAHSAPGAQLPDVVGDPLDGRKHAK